MVEGGVGSRARRDHFAQLVSSWSHFGAPLRPSPADTEVVEQAASGLSPGARVAVLGLTPETIACHWPERALLLALDHSPAMVAALWPQPGAPPGSGAVLADWQTLPLPDASLDLVCGDGCYVVLAYPQGYSALAAEVRRVLRPGGRLVVRVFIRPDDAEPLASIHTSLAAGRIGSVHALKLRLLASLHGHSGAGTLLDDVWQAWRRLPAVPPKLAGQCGWTSNEISGIEGYAGLATRYYLPTLAELRAVHAPLLREVACHVGDYEQAATCPTLVLERQEDGHGA